MQRNSARKCDVIILVEELKKSVCTILFFCGGLVRHVHTAIVRKCFTLFVPFKIIVVVAVVVYHHIVNKNFQQLC